MNGWCSTPGTHGMFVGMEDGPPIMISWDECSSGSSNPYLDLCDVGMKDMGGQPGQG